MSYMKYQHKMNRDYKNELQRIADSLEKLVEILKNEKKIKNKN